MKIEFRYAFASSYSYSAALSQTKLAGQRLERMQARPSFAATDQLAWRAA